MAVKKRFKKVVEYKENDLGLALLPSIFFLGLLLLAFSGWMDYWVSIIFSTTAGAFLLMIIAIISSHFYKENRKVYWVEVK